MLEIDRQTLLGAVQPYEPARHAANLLVVTACKIPHVGTFNLYDAGAKVGQLPRRERRSYRLNKLSQAAEKQVSGEVSPQALA
jgi:hypothetical protein